MSSKSYITNDTLVTIDYLKQISNNDPKIERVISFLESELRTMPEGEDVTYSDGMKVKRAVVILSLFIDSVSKTEENNVPCDDMRYCLEKIKDILTSNMGRKL